MRLVIRAYNTRDLEAMVALFYSTVHAVNAQHYTAEQLAAWAAEAERLDRVIAWAQSFSENFVFVAERGHELVGFAELSRNGFLERLYVHKDFQRQGIASALLEKSEVAARTLGAFTMETDASITARPFFVSQGYTLVRPQWVERHGVFLPNFRMAKRI